MDDDRPLGGYALLAGTFATVFGGSLMALRAGGRELPDRVSAGDVALAALTTHKLSRLLTREKVMAPLRAPVTEVEETPSGEQVERPSGDGVQRAVGELLTCPYCAGQWIAGAIALGWVGAPRTTRLLTSMWGALALSDYSQAAFVGLQNARDRA